MHRHSECFSKPTQEQLTIFFSRIRDFPGELVDSYHEIVSYCQELGGSIELVRQRCNFCVSGNSSGTLFLLLSSAASLGCFCS